MPHPAETEMARKRAATRKQPHKKAGPDADGPAQPAVANAQTNVEVVPTQTQSPAAAVPAPSVASIIPLPQIIVPILDRTLRNINENDDSDDESEASDNEDEPNIPPSQTAAATSGGPSATTPVRKTKFWYTAVTLNMRSEAKLKVSALVAQWDLELKRSLTGKLGDRIGTKADSLAENSLKAYEKHYRGLTHFCTWIGDYESLVMLDNFETFAFCPSIRRETIMKYL
ncbi:hypothetical protein HDU96_001720, partial [Phlyctochytrium bullatum]